MGPYLEEGGVGHTGAPVPLFSVPETHPPGAGDGGGSVAVVGAPEGRAYEETLQMYPVSGKTCQQAGTLAVIPGAEEEVGEIPGPGEAAGPWWIKTWMVVHSSLRSFP